MQKLMPYFIKIIGGVLLLVGLVGAYYGPLEIYVFYFFSEGGRFHYEGFGIGSIWFAYLVIQNLGYYIVAALFIPISLGHLKLKRWALTLTQLYLWFWLGAGILLALNLLLFIPSVLRLELNQDVLLPRIIIAGIFLALFLVLMPVLGLCFYRSKKVRSVFVEHDPNIYWTERYPFPLLALNILFVIMILVMHITIFFQAVFPVFGQLILGREAVYVIALCILLLGILMYGIIRIKKWAWWGSLVYLSLLVISATMSFSRYSFYEIIQMMELPAYEMEFINQMALLHNFHLVGLVAIPLIVALCLLIFSKRYFSQTAAAQITSEI